MLLCAASVMSTVSLVYWNLWQPPQAILHLATGDVLYLLEYALLGAALASLLAVRVGTLRSSLVWLDGLSLFASVIAVVWVIVFGPLAPAQTAGAIPWSYAAAYGIAAALLLMLGSLHWLHAAAGRSRRWVAALVGASFVQAAWIIGWIGCWLTQSDFLGYLADFGEVICFMLVSIAAMEAADSPCGTSGAPDVQRTAFVFLPTLGVLVVIALISGLVATNPGTGPWIVTGLILICSLLLMTRHRFASAELERLRNELARRESDERISELVRQSSDGFVVVSDDGLVRYASPAVEAVLHTSPARLVGTAFSATFGPSTATIEQFLEAVRVRQTGEKPIELTVPVAADASRLARIVATNRLDNPRIGGIVLVVTDITRERSLEREVIDVANAERLRLAADVHDGIGQDLTGIALLLKGFVNGQDEVVPRERQEFLKIIGYLNATIRKVRDLAHGLSPLYVVHGSLIRALQALAGGAASPHVEVIIDPHLVDRLFDAATSEHLYRIAAEAVQNAHRHAACTRIGVSLCLEADAAVLSITDDGRGFQPEDPTLGRRGAGLRLMEYRARVISAALQIESRPAKGTRVMVTIRHRDGVPIGDCHGLEMASRQDWHR